MTKTLTAGLICTAALLAVGATPAAAKGCNGYVNQMQWGCAPWDNNNGPQFPHYKAPAPVRPGVPMQNGGTPAVQPGNGAGLLSPNGGNLIGHDSGNGAGLIGKAR